jgi:hypothetical protein
VIVDVLTKVSLSLLWLQGPVVGCAVRRTEPICLGLLPLIGRGARRQHKTLHLLIVLLTLKDSARSLIFSRPRLSV